jgi:hypothetical protein
MAFERHIRELNPRRRATRWLWWITGLFAFVAMLLAVLAHLMEAHADAPQSPIRSVRIPGSPCYFFVPAGGVLILSEPREGGHSPPLDQVWIQSLMPSVLFVKPAYGFPFLLVGDADRLESLPQYVASSTGLNELLSGRKHALDFTLPDDSRAYHLEVDVGRNVFILSRGFRIEPERPLVSWLVGATDSPPLTPPDLDSVSASSDHP